MFACGMGFGLMRIIAATCLLIIHMRVIKRGFSNLKKVFE